MKWNKETYNRKEKKKIFLKIYVITEKNKIWKQKHSRMSSLQFPF